jgi:SulP family sulfate permease
MFIVVIGTFEWSSFRILNKIPKSDAFIIALVSGVTVITDLAMAVVVGVIVSALVFAWEHAKHVLVTRKENAEETRYEIEGPLFFGSATEFSQCFTPKEDRDDVYIDFANSRVADHSGLEAIEALAERYTSAGKRLHLLHLSSDCRLLLKRAKGMVEVNVLEDPKYFVADDALA